MSATATIDPSFSRKFGEWAAAAGKSIPEAFKMQGRLFCHELIQRTPPFSGKAIVRMLEAKGAMAGLRDGELEDMTARQVGARRVEKDIRRIIYGMNGANPNQAAQVYKGQNRNVTYSREAISDWGVLQNCQGKPAVRIFANKGGTVYGVDLVNFNPEATIEQLVAHHTAQRTKRGRVTTAGSKDTVVGRWRWLNIFITKDSTAKSFIKKKIRSVGNAKGGWAAGFKKLGGKMSSNGWVGRHSAAGNCTATFGEYNASIQIVNRSRWATGGDPDRIIAKSMQGRGRAIERDIERLLKEKWGKAQ